MIKEIALAATMALPQPYTQKTDFDLPVPPEHEIEITYRRNVPEKYDAETPVPHEHSADLAYLQKRLLKEGYDISDYLKDPRFEIIEPVWGKAVDYTDTLECHYMRDSTIKASADYMESKYYWLNKGEDKWGPPPKITTAKLALESGCGTNVGQYIAFNALVSRWLHRSEKQRNFYYENIKSLLYLYRERPDIFRRVDNDTIIVDDLLDIMGSRAGALGFQQIMPYNVEEFSVDFNDNGFNLYEHPDAIGTSCYIDYRNGYKSQPKKALQLYNPGDSWFYSKGIRAHGNEAEKVFLKRRRELSENTKPISPASGPIFDSPVKSLPLREMKTNPRPIDNRKRRFFGRKAA